jgi:hypothetical protein
MTKVNVMKTSVPKCDAGSRSPLAGEPKPTWVLVGGDYFARHIPHQNREGRFWLPRKGGAGAYGHCTACTVFMTPGSLPLA